MTFGLLLDLRPRIDSAEFRALLLLLVGWRNEPELDQARLDRVIRRYRSSPNLHVLGFERGTRTLAMIAIEAEEKGRAVVQQIVVQPELRGHGLGRALIQGAQSRLGLSGISAETDQQAVGLYERVGLRVSSLGEKYPGVERFLCRN